MAENSKPSAQIAPRRYVVDRENCAAHQLCVDLAPHNFRWEIDGAYVFKQPATPEEEAQCREALEACPMAAIRDDGERTTDP